MAKHQSLMMWVECKKLFNSLYQNPVEYGAKWPNKLGLSELAIMQTIDRPQDSDGWLYAIAHSVDDLQVENITLTRDNGFSITRKDVAFVTPKAFADYLRFINEKPSRLVAAWFDVFGINEAIAEPKDKSVADDGVKKGRRDKQINLICETAKGFEYDLLEIPEGGKALIKTECLKNAILFTNDGFKRAWTEANKRELISMRDKGKYL